MWRGICFAVIGLPSLLRGGEPADPFVRIERRYVAEFLRRNPVVATYLGGAGFDPSLSGVDGRLRDWSEKSLDDEDACYRKIGAELSAIPAGALSAPQRIDRDVILSQIAFLHHQDAENKYWQRSLDTYVSEAFRGVDWQMQAMTGGAGGRLGTREEWDRVAERVSRIPAYLEVARANIAAGTVSGIYPDWRMIERDGLQAAEANADYFADRLPALAAARTAGESFSSDLASRLRRDGAAAAKAFRAFRSFLLSTFVETEAPLRFKARYSADRYAAGEAEYAWRVKNVLKFTEPVEEIFARFDGVISRDRNKLMEAAQRVAEARRLNLPWETVPERDASTRRVFDELAKDFPKNDEELIGWHRDTARRLVDYGRRNELFEIPPDYRLEIVLTPPALESSIEGASYFPAPPFKNSGAGRYYVTGTHGDPEKLKQQNRWSLASLSAHEGFPGHDWHFKVMTQYRSEISPVRWLTPGEVEGSSAMWGDSVAAEGWAHYAELLLSEPGSKVRGGFYSPEELVYQLKAALYRDLRVRVDIGLHTGRISYAEATDLFSRVTDFLPGSCEDRSLSPAKAASCDSSEKAIFRYSKWPTQAITYRLGKERVLALREEARKIDPGAGGEKRFHLLFMKQGTIPPDLFRDELLSDLKPK
jgi:uncharacterized protein (DUF885 family)